VGVSIRALAITYLPVFKQYPTLYTLGESLIVGKIIALVPFRELRFLLAFKALKASTIQDKYGILLKS